MWRDTFWFNENDDLYYAWDVKQKKEWLTIKTEQKRTNFISLLSGCLFKNLYLKILVVVVAAVVVVVLFIKYFMDDES